MLINGLHVRASPLVTRTPRVSLSPLFNACSEHVKNDMNAWLLEMFGDKETCIVTGGIVYVSPATYARLRAGGVVR